MQWRWRLVNLALGLALVVVLLGGWTRLNDAGLGCPDWPACYGHLVLPPAAQVAERIAPHFPGHEVDLTKGWIEMIHRYAASLLGLVIILQALCHLRHRPRMTVTLRLALLLSLLVVVQGLFGMWTVTLKLVPWVVTLHLLGGLLTLTLLVRLRQHLRRERLGGQSVQRRDGGVRLLLAALFLQLALGGWTSTNYAGWACDGWFSCRQDSTSQYDFVAAFNLVMPLGHSYEGGLLPLEARAAIQMTHRIGALLVLCLFAIAARKLRSDRELRPWLALCGGLIGLQILLGGLNAVWHLPLVLAVAHHFVAVMLLLAVLGLYERAESRKQEVLNGYLSLG